MTLGDYIQQTSRLPWSWGIVDCTMWVADWVLLQTGVDPAVALRGSYASEEEADGLVADGLVPVIEAQGVLTATDAPQANDVGVIEVMGRQVAAIHAGEGWAFRHPEGVGVVRAEPLAAWTLPGT